METEVTQPTETVATPAPVPNSETVSEVNQVRQTDADDWDGPRQSPEAMQAEESLKTLYPNDQQPEAKPEPPKETKPETPAELQWTDEDMQLAGNFPIRAQQLQAKAQELQQLKSLDLNQISGGDTMRALVIKQELQEYEAALNRDYEDLQIEAQTLKGRAEVRKAEQQTRTLKAEQKKLAERVPDLNKVALKSYLAETGFSEAEIGSVGDARVIEMLEKARRYDAQQKLSKAPKKRFKPPSRMKVKSLSAINERQKMLESLYGRTTKVEAPEPKTSEKDRTRILYG